MLVVNAINCIKFDYNRLRAFAWRGIVKLTLIDTAIWRLSIYHGMTQIHAAIIMTLIETAI